MPGGIAKRSFGEALISPTNDKVVPETSQPWRHGWQTLDDALFGNRMRADYT